MIFIDSFDNSLIVTEFKYFFTVFVYNLSVLSCDLVFVNDHYFSNLFFSLFCSNYRELVGCCFHG